MRAPDHSADEWRRRAAMILSLVGMASLGATTLLQTGVVRHLPDPPLRGFDSDKVNLSRRAFPLGIPDGALGVLSFAANLPLVALSDPARAAAQPWIPLLTGGKALIDTVVASWYFYQMPARERAWCVYCIVGQIASLGVTALTLPGAIRALGAWRRAPAR